MKREIRDWYVITGGPSAGSSTLVAALSEKGFLVEPEAARALIDRELASDMSLEAIREDELAFQRKVLALKVRRELEIPKDKTVFFDRAIPDTIAYYRFYGAPEEEIRPLLKTEYPYKKVFLLDMLNYQKDYSRVEDSNAASAIRILLESVYIEIGIPVIRVPFMPVEERIGFVLSNC